MWQPEFVHKAIPVDLKLQKNVKNWCYQQKKTQTKPSLQNSSKAYQPLDLKEKKTTVEKETVTCQVRPKS